MVERIFWLVAGVVLLVWAGVAFFGDGVDISQNAMDAVQNVVLGLLALGMAYRSYYYDGRGVR